MRYRGTPNMRVHAALLVYPVAILVQASFPGVSFEFPTHHSLKTSSATCCFLNRILNSWGGMRIAPPIRLHVSSRTGRHHQGQKKALSLSAVR